jgi:chorismate synthase
MSVNSFGNILRLTTFGESHGFAIGGILDGFPSGILLDTDFIQNQLNKRRPGQSKITTSRNEPDKLRILSGVFEGKSTGTPIAFMVENSNQRSSDYHTIADSFRPSHADYTYSQKYGIRDYRGGGRSSARTTVSQVIGGSIAQHLLWPLNIRITAFTSAVGNIKLNKLPEELDFSLIEQNLVRCPDMEIAEEMTSFIEKIKDEGDTVGGIITCMIENVPAGWGEPVFEKLHARLGFAMLNINAVKGFEIGSGFDGIKLKGSQHNDLFFVENGKVFTKTNFSGGVQGGISNGQSIYFNVAFKPVATLLQNQKTINAGLQEVSINPGGRHDPCVVPRAVPIVEAMSALVLADFFLLHNARKY